MLTSFFNPDCVKPGELFLWRRQSGEALTSKYKLVASIEAKLIQCTISLLLNISYNKQLYSFINNSCIYTCLFDNYARHPITRNLVFVVLKRA
jgi:hypothetical protein